MSRQDIVDRSIEVASDMTTVRFRQSMKWMGDGCVINCSIAGSAMSLNVGRRNMISSEWCSRIGATRGGEETSVNVSLSQSTAPPVHVNSSISRESDPSVDESIHTTEIDCWVAVTTWNMSSKRA
jgi:hypothetical protein